MNYLTIFLIGLISGLSLSIFFKKNKSRKKGQLVNKEEASKGTQESKKRAEEVEYPQYEETSHDLLNAEKEFYDEDGIE